MLAHDREVYGALGQQTQDRVAVALAQRHGDVRDVPAEKSLFIGQSNITMAEQVAEKMATDLGGKGNIVVLTGLKGSSPAVDRNTGMENVLAKYPDIKVIAVGDAQWIREPAVPLMEDFLTANSDIAAVFSHAEESAWGAQPFARLSRS